MVTIGDNLSVDENPLYNSYFIAEGISKLKTLYVCVCVCTCLYAYEINI